MNKDYYRTNHYGRNAISSPSGGKNKGGPVPAGIQGIHAEREVSTYPIYLVKVTDEKESGGQDIARSGFYGC